MPAILAAGASGIDIASFTRRPVLPDGARGTVFQDYAAALARSAADTVYVSTRNHEHVTWALAALETGRHVIVDKPAALSLRDVEAIADLAARRGLLVAEATVYPFHPQVRALEQLAAESGGATRLVATFSFPPLPASNVRLQSAWGGGMLWDLGPYAVSPGRLFFGDPPLAMSACIEPVESGDVDAAFSVLIRYPGDRVMVGHFGMTTAYVNRMSVIGPRLDATLDRAFTTAPNQTGRIVGLRDGRPLSLDVPAADAFEQFFRAVFATTPEGRPAFADTMLADARAIDQLRRAAGVAP